MNRIHTLLSPIFFFAAALLYLGCADAVDDYAAKNPNGTIGTDTDDNGNSGKGDNPGGSTSDPSGSGETPDKPSSGGKEDEDPSGKPEPTKCAEGLSRCTAEGKLETCLQGKYTIQNCDGTCYQNACQPFNENSCTAPAEMRSGDVKTLNTNTRQTYTIASPYSACTKIHPRLAVAKLNIDTLGYYEISARRTAGSSAWGIFGALDCITNNFYQDSCYTTQKDQYAMVRLLSPGSYFVFVGAADIKQGVTPPALDIELSVNASEAQKNACAYDGNIEILDANQKQHTLKNQTSSGASKIQAESADTYKCRNATTGNEVAYSFQLREQTTVSFELAFQRNDGTPCIDSASKNGCPTNAVVHIQTCSDTATLGNRDNTQICIVEETTSKDSLSGSVDLPPGEYLLFVDSDSQRTGFAYELTLHF